MVASKQKDMGGACETPGKMKSAQESYAKVPKKMEN
jgi:hypothetical protein